MFNKKKTLLVRIIVIVIAYSLILSVTPVWADTSRDQLIARQMDCVEHNKQSPTIGWSDVCSLDTTSAPAENSQVAPDQSQSPALDTKPYRALEEIPYFGKQQLNPRHVNTLEIGADPEYYSYAEHDAKVKVRGMMTDYFANYTYRPADGNILNNQVLNMYRLEGRYALGDLDYKGSGTLRSPNTNYELRALAGKDYLIADKSLITPYLGFGYRNLFDKGNGYVSTAHDYSYDRHSNYFYLPIGLSAEIPHGAWTNGLNIEYDILLKGIQVSDLSDGDQFTGFNNPNIHNYQDSGYGIRGSFKFMYATPLFNFYIEPYVRYWSIGRSSLVSATVDGSFSSQWNEPKNTTVEAGSKFGLQF